MPNSQSPTTKAIRAKNAARWIKERQAAGAYRLSVLLPPTSAAQLQALAAIHGSKRAAIIAVLDGASHEMNNMNFFIIADGSPVALVTTQATPGPCVYSTQRCRLAFSASRQWTLVNARKGTISRAQKWQDWEMKNGVILPAAVELNPGEFFIESGE